jgi:hypothetical protein
MPGKAEKLGLNDHPFRRSNEFQTLGFVANAAIARSESQRVADVFGSGRDIEQQSRFAWISLPGEVQSEFIISERLRRVLKQLALLQSRDAMLAVVNIAFRDANALQERRYRDVALAKDGDRLPSSNPVALGKATRLVSSVTFNGPSVRAELI